MSDTNIGARLFVALYFSTHTGNCLNRSKYNVDFDDFSISTPHSIVKSFRTKRRDLSWIFSILRASALEHMCQIKGQYIKFEIIKVLKIQYLLSIGSTLLCLYKAFN